MELLYFLDRTITRLIQAFSRMVSGRLHISLKVQSRILFMVTAFVLGMFAHRLKLKMHLPGNVLVEIGCYFVFAIVYWIGAGVVERCLFFLHKFFDSEGALSTDKLYDGGYIAWSEVIVSALSFLLYHLFADSSVSLFFYFGGIVVLTIGAYRSFAMRKRGNSSKKRSWMTQALSDLLERCKGWLPVPQLAES